MKQIQMQELKKGDTFCFDMKKREALIVDQVKSTSVDCFRKDDKSRYPKRINKKIKGKVILL